MKKINVIVCVLIAFTLSLGVTTTFAANVDGPAIFWKLSTWGKPRSFTKGAEHLANRLAEETGGKFQLSKHTQTTVFLGAI